MNNISIVGRIVKDLNISLTSNNVKYCRFTVAVPSEVKGENGERQADFFVCIAWRETAENICKYFKKGVMIGLVGAMNSRIYNKDGVDNTFWELNVQKFSFIYHTVGKEEAEEDTPKENEGNLPF